MSIKLTASADSALRYQRYDQQPTIEGVLYASLTKHRALEGWFMELYRLTDGTLTQPDLPLNLRQLSLSRAEPHRRNAFHVHPKRPQDELWCVLDGSMLVWLVDVRAESSTSTVKRRYLLSGEAPALLYIPSGVAHGYQAGPAGALLLYGMSGQFDPDDPNEGRLPWDHFGAELWAEDRG